MRWVTVVTTDPVATCVTVAPEDAGMVAAAAAGNGLRVAIREATEEESEEAERRNDR